MLEKQFDVVSGCFFWCGVLCENCIVDASIKLHACCCHFFVWWWVCGLCDFCSFVFCVVHASAHDDGLLLCVVVVCSLLRAHGGCLGMLSR